MEPEITLETHHETVVAHVKADGVLLTNTQDALDLLANCGYQGADYMIVGRELFTPAFFDLKTGIAGDMLQKFTNYRMHLAITGDFSGYGSKALNDFIYESNKAGKILFVGSAEEALERWRLNA